MENLRESFCTLRKVAKRVKTKEEYKSFLNDIKHPSISESSRKVLASMAKKTLTEGVRLSESVSQYLTVYEEDRVWVPQEGGGYSYGLRAVGSYPVTSVEEAREIVAEFAGVPLEAEEVQSEDEYWLIPNEYGEMTICAIENDSNRGNRHSPAKTWDQGEFGYEAPLPKFDEKGRLVEAALGGETSIEYFTRVGRESFEGDFARLLMSELGDPKDIRFLDCYCSQTKDKPFCDFTVRHDGEIHKYRVHPGQVTIKEAYPGEGTYKAGPYWYYTKHGVGPGMLPKGYKVEKTVEDEDFGTYVALDQPLTAEEEKEYELIKKKPEMNESEYVPTIEYTLEKGDDITIWWRDPSWDKNAPCYASCTYTGRTRDGKYKFQSNTYGHMFLVDAKNNTVITPNGKEFQLDTRSGWTKIFSNGAVQESLKLDESLFDFDDEAESAWERVKTKQVLDSDGFWTDYTWYTNGETHIFIFGDNECYTPENSTPDWECETEAEAQEWFDSYNGFEDDFVEAEGDECPLGGDISNDCEGCVYSTDYHYVNGECVRRNSSLKESEQKPLYKKPDGSYIVRADSGKGFSVFNKHGVSMGGIDDENGDMDDQTAIDRFKKGDLDESYGGAIKNGSSYIFNTTQSDLVKYNGTEVTVIRPLTDKECDISDVGNMYRVKFNDGTERDAFEDELSDLDESLTEGQQLNEGPGAGYEISCGINITGLENVNVTDITCTDRTSNYNEYDVKLSCNGTGFVEDLEAYSYYYGDVFRGDHEVTIDSLVVSVSVGPDVDIDHFVSTIDFASMLIGGKVESKFVYGGGWSHSTFDGTVSTIGEPLQSSFIEYGGEYEVELYKMSAKLTNEELIVCVDDAVTGADQYDDDFIEESVDPSTLTDCPECGDISFNSKSGRCTKCSYRESLVADEHADDEETLTEGYRDMERISALATYLEVDEDSIQPVTYASNIFEVEDAEWAVLTEDEAEQAAKNDIQNLYDDIGVDSFTPWFRDWIYDNAVDREWFEEALKESFENYVADIKDEDDRLQQEMDDAGVDDEEEFVDYLVRTAGDPIEYYVDNFGSDAFRDICSQNNLIDIDAVAEKAIEEDGVAHFVARYDGKEVDLGDGLFAYRLN